MENGFYIVEDTLSLRETVTYKTRSEAQRKIDRNKTMVACCVMSRDEYMTQVRSRQYPLEAKVYWRESTGEWVLDISGVINGVDLGARHTQSGNILPHNVPGLPETYSALDDAPGQAFYTQAWEV